jgi:3-hydroxyisobutyrate dehydrogenase-like beta-hydroxyacid dehydrogenase
MRTAGGSLNMPRPIGLIGVGNIGGRVGRRLVAAGERVIAYDVDPARATDSGLDGRGSIQEVTAETDVVLLSLPDSTVIERVVHGPDGLATSCRAGQTIVDLSTASPKSTVAIHEVFAQKGVEFLDAGVSGGAKAAEAGRLTLMVGGGADALEHVRALLEKFSESIFHMGAPGAGHIAKLLNNYLNGTSLATTAEVMVAARKSGLNPELLLEVINKSSGLSFASVNRFPNIVKGDYMEGGLTGRLMAKDLRLYLEYIEQVGVPSLPGPAVFATFEITNGLGYADMISNYVVDGLGDLAGGVRIQAESVNDGEPR